jgi:hypothetical protein
MTFNFQLNAPLMDNDDEMSWADDNLKRYAPCTGNGVIILITSMEWKSSEVALRQI